MQLILKATYTLFHCCLHSAGFGSFCWEKKRTYQCEGCRNMWITDNSSMQLPKNTDIDTLPLGRNLDHFLHLLLLPLPETCKYTLCQAQWGLKCTNILVFIFYALKPVNKKQNLVYLSVSNPPWNLPHHRPPHPLHHTENRAGRGQESVMNSIKTTFLQTQIFGLQLL